MSQLFSVQADFLPHLLLGRVVGWLGADEFSIRLPSALPSFLVVTAVYVLARRVADRPTALLASFCVAIAPYQVWYAQEARRCASLCLVAILALYFFYRLLDKPDWRAWLGLTVDGAPLGRIRQHLAQRGWQTLNLPISNMDKLPCRSRMWERVRSV